MNRKRWLVRVNIGLIFFIYYIASTIISVAGSNDFTISDGSRVDISKKGFSITPPIGWEIHRNFPGTSLLLQIPYSKQMEYQRTIQIMTFNGPKYIDEITATEFEELIIRKFSKASSSIQNYRIRNHLMTKMEDGREAILFYCEFELNGRNMMQAHILTSSNKLHYLSTFTDIVEHFEGDEENEILTQAWESMISLKLSGPTLSRHSFTKKLIFAGIAFLLIMLLLLVYRKKKATYNLSKYNLEDSGDGTIKSTDMELYSGYEASQEGLLKTGDEIQDLSSASSWLVKKGSKAEASLPPKQPESKPNTEDQFNTSQYSIDPVKTGSDDDDEKKDSNTWNLLN